MSGTSVNKPVYAGGVHVKAGPHPRDVLITIGNVNIPTYEATIYLAARELPYVELKVPVEKVDVEVLQRDTHIEVVKGYEQ